jgi:catechol 2,3-dioxygenase-like lactoylglutathione lyase family enzyme
VLDHVSIIVDDLDAAITFYDAVLGALGHARVYRTDTAAGYGARNSAEDDSHTYLSIVGPASCSSSSARPGSARRPAIRPRRTTALWSSSSVIGPSTI